VNVCSEQRHALPLDQLFSCVELNTHRITAETSPGGYN
jgi:hypothetical protein